MWRPDGSKAQQRPKISRDMRPLRLTVLARCGLALCRDGKWRPAEPGTFPLADAGRRIMGRVESRGGRSGKQQPRRLTQRLWKRHKRSGSSGLSFCAYMEVSDISAHLR